MEDVHFNRTGPPFQICGHFLMPELHLSRGIMVAAITNCILNSPTAISALIANSIILVAFFRDHSLRSTANNLLAWLALTDVLVGGIVQPLNIATHIEILLTNRNCVVNGVYDGVKFLSSMMSVMTALFISFDRCFAVTLPFKYSTWVTTRRVFLVLIISWLFWITIVASWTLGLAGVYLQISCVSVMIITFVILGAVYTKMVKLAHQHQHQITSQQQAGQPSTNTYTTRQRKALRTAMVVIGALMLCYLPIVVVVIVDIITAYTAHSMTPGVRYIVASYAETFVFFNSTLNPIIYCLRSSEIRMAVWKVLGFYNGRHGMHGSITNSGTRTRGVASSPTAHPDWKTTTVL